MLEVSVTNLASGKIDDQGVIDFARQVLGKLEQKEFELSIVIVDPDRMEHLNTIYKHRSGTTDVLSFPLQGEKSGAKAGEVVINLDEAKKLSQPADKTGLSGLKYLLIHGILHLTGYDHEGVSQSQSVEMNEKQQQLTEEFNVDVKPELSH